MCCRNQKFNVGISTICEHIDDENVVEFPSWKFHWCKIILASFLLKRKELRECRNHSRVPHRVMKFSTSRPTYHRVVRCVVVYRTKMHFYNHQHASRANDTSKLKGGNSEINDNAETRIYKTRNPSQERIANLFKG